MVIIVFGLPGSGKSYFAERLAEQQNAIYINSDELRIKMFPKRSYTDAEKTAVYDAMLTAMTDVLPQKKTIVLDGTFSKASWRKKFEEAASQWKERILYMEVTAPENKIEERLKTPRKFSEANYDVYLKLKAGFEPVLKEHLVLVSSDTNISAMLREAVRYIQTRI